MARNNYQAGLFEQVGQPTHSRPLPFSPFPLTKTRRLASPTHISRIPRGTDIAKAVRGAQMLGLPLLKQGEEVAAVLEAARPDGRPLYPTVTVLIPRRGTKTTSIWATILGRCDQVPGYRAVTTAQDGLRARNRIREVMRTLQRHDFEGDEDRTNRIGTLRWSNGEESIEFDNGSRLWVVPPDPGAFRSEAADVMLFDEAGELSADKSDNLVAGALPLMDTRPMGQAIVAGTPAPIRSGLLWDNLQAGINKIPGTGVVAYMIRDDEHSLVYDEDGNPQLNEKLLRRVHPGIGPLTTMETMRSRFAKMPLAKFEMEYLCRFPFDGTVSAISPKAWSDCSAGDSLPTRPDRVGLAYDVSPDGSTAALVAAWRDDQGIAHLEVLACRPGTAWLPDAAVRAARKHRAPIAYDQIGANSDPAERLTRARVRVEGLALKAMQGAAARLVREIEANTLRHYNQPDLDNAVAGVTWRAVGEGGRLFARKASTNDVSSLVAASAALWQADRNTRRPVTTTFASGDNR